MSCDLKYIPERLHYTADKPLIDTYAVDDVLYRRAKEDQVTNPFATISLTDLSHNIGTNIGLEISKMADVLYSILHDGGVEVYDEKVVSLKIISLDENNRYDKTFICHKNEHLKVRAILQHSPECCMYPHASFKFFVYNDQEEEIEVTFHNYKATLGHKRYKYLRDSLRQELSKMIIREVISQDDLD